MKNLNKNLILIGGGNFALEIYSYIQEEINRKSLSNVTIKGVIDKELNCLLIQKHPEVSFLGSVEDYIPEENDYGLVTIGNAARRREIFIRLNKKVPLPLLSYVHSSAYVSSSAHIGNGVLIGPHCIVSAHSFIDNNVALNVYCGVGHGASIGSHSVMSPYSVINGDCKLEESVFLGSRVTLNPKVTVGAFSLIDAGCILREDIKPLSIVSQRVEQKLFDNRILRRQLERDKSYIDSFTNNIDKKSK